MSDEVTTGGSRPPVELELTWEKMGLVLLLLLLRHTWSTGATAERHKGGGKIPTGNHEIPRQQEMFSRTDCGFVVCVGIV